MEMEEFKKDLLHLCKRSIVAPVIFLIIAVLCAGFGMLMSETDYAVFDGMESGYATMDLVYVMGPFAEQTDGEKTVNEYYIAEDADGYWSVIGTGVNNDFPVFGEDVTGEDIYNLTPQTVYGYGTEIPDELVDYIVEFFEESGVDLTAENYADYLGSYYLDTTDTDSDGDSLFFYILATVMLILAVVTFFAGGSKRKKTEKQLKAMEESGEIMPIFNDFSTGPRFFYEKVKVAMSGHYLLDFNVTDRGFRVVPLQDIVNVFKCNMVSGEPTSTSYIALETSEGQRYLVAASPKTGQEFENVIMQLRSLLMIQ